MSHHWVIDGKLYINDSDPEHPGEPDVDLNESWGRREDGLNRLGLTLSLSKGQIISKYDGSGFGTMSFLEALGHHIDTFLENAYEYAYVLDLSRSPKTRQGGAGSTVEIVPQSVPDDPAELRRIGGELARMLAVTQAELTMLREIVLGDDPI